MQCDAESQIGIPSLLSLQNVIEIFKECGLEVETDSGSISQHCRVDIQRGHLKKNSPLKSPNFSEK